MEEKMTKLLTIVVPSYNVEKYLRQTIESFLDERVIERIEVLIVDDGSQDETAKIAMEYRTKFPNSIRLISKENGGHGSTINRGIQEASGKYFKVVDGDDWVNTEDFVKLVEKLKNCNSDYVVTNYYEVNDNTGELTPKSYPALRREGEQKFEEIAHRVQMGMHSLTIKTKLLKENKIQLDEHCFYVDVEYILFPVPYVHTVEYFELFVYMYRLAQATQSVSMSGYQKHMQNHIDVIMHLTDFLEAYRGKVGDTEKTEYIGKRIAQMIGDQITIFLSFSLKNKEIKEKFIAFDEELKKKSRYIYELSGRESGILRVLRKSRFKGYYLIVEAGRIKHGMRDN